MGCPEGEALHISSAEQRFRMQKGCRKKRHEDLEIRVEMEIGILFVLVEAQESFNRAAIVQKKLLRILEPPRGN